MRLWGIGHVIRRCGITARSPLCCLYRCLSHDAKEHSPSVLPVSNAEVVVCGGGLVGVSAAYHLVERGLTNVVLLEQNTLGQGTTWYSAGIVGQVKGSAFETRVIKYSLELYKTLAEIYGTKWQACGTLFLARTADRQHYFERRHQDSLNSGVRTELWNSAAVTEKYPFLNDQDLKGALWIPDDGIIDTVEMLNLLARLFTNKGGHIITNCKVENVISRDKHVVGVETSKGYIQCKQFVNCAGQWARSVAKSSRVKVPMHSVEHYYLLAKPADTSTSSMPVIRDYDNHSYFREWDGNIMIGAFEAVAKPVYHSGVPPDSISTNALPEDWDHLQFMLEKGLHVIPSLRNAVVQKVVNGSESFTPDRQWIVGRAPELSNYYVAAGMCGAGVAAAGGVGRKVAELVAEAAASATSSRQWMFDNGSSEWYWNIDIRRFVDLHNNMKYLRERVKEVVGSPYGQQGVRPYKEYLSSRKLRTSPLYTCLQNYGAVFGETVGFERALYFQSNDADAPDMQRSENLEEGIDSRSLSPTAFAKPVWFKTVRDEYWACREGVGLIDMSSFTKTEIKSQDRSALDFLQYVCSNDMDKPVGTVMHTGMLNSRGGYENDCSVYHANANSFLVISPASQRTRSLAWITDQLATLPGDRRALQVNDVTSMYTVLNLIGPKAKELLACLADVSTHATDFPQMTGKTIYVGNAGGIIAMRMTHTGEDGFILYIPSEYALHVYDCLMNVGKDYGIRNVGDYALRSLRTEKFLGYWGTDLNTDVTPFECMRDNRVKLETNIDFIGRDALLLQRAQGIKKKFVMFTLEDHDCNSDFWPWGGEPIYRNGRFVGTVSSTSFGYALDKIACLGFVHRYGDDMLEELHVTNKYIAGENAAYTIAIGNKRFQAKPSIYAPKVAQGNLGYLPTRLKSKQAQ